VSTRIADGRKGSLFNNLDEIPVWRAVCHEHTKTAREKALSANPLGNLDGMPGAFAFRF